MTATWAIAIDTLREALRHRVFYLLFAFALALMVSANVLGLLTVGSEAKILQDVGLAAIQMFGVLTAVLLGVGLVSGEIERRTVYTIVTRPLERWQFVVGKFLGLLLVLAINVALMTAALYAVLALRGIVEPRLLAAIGTIGVELVVVTAMALFFSSFSSTALLSTLFTFGFWIAGKLSWSLLLLRDRLASEVGRHLCTAVYYLLPNLDGLDLKGPAVHGLDVAPAAVGYAVAHALAYATALVLLSCAVFARRDFT